MKIATLNSPITHERKPQYEHDRANPIEELIAAIDDMIEELCPLDEVAEALVDTLRKVNPGTKEVVVVEHTCLISLNDTLREVDIRGFTFADLFTSMVAAVLN